MEFIHLLFIKQYLSISNIQGVYSGLVIIISQNSSKSMDPEPSSSSSSRIPSSSSSVRGARSSLMSPLRVSVVMQPRPSLSYILKRSTIFMMMFTLSISLGHWMSKTTHLYYLKYLNVERLKSMLSNATCNLHSCSFQC